MNRGDQGELTLHLRGPARLEHQSGAVKLRRKGLGLLYFLALEGPSRRERLADVLWGHSTAAANLRVELHRLREALGALGCRAFEDGEDPLTLPACIRVEKAPGAGEAMEGLEDLSHDFQLWLEGQRAHLSSEAVRFPEREGLVRELAEQVRQAGLPFVIILKGQPGSGQGEMARRLAGMLGLPFVEGPNSVPRALRHIALPAANQAQLFGRMLGDRDSVWVVERSAFGEDPRFLLELRGEFPPERVRYVDLPPLSWREVCRQLLYALPFAEAAELYLATGGNPGYLRDLLAVRPQGGFGSTLPVPQRVRAAYGLEARYLSQEARFALERLSIHPGVLSEGLIAELRAEPHLDELERRGWLTYSGAWRFVDETVRRVLYDGLPEGQRQRYHETAARQFGVEGKVLSEAYHLAWLQGKLDESLLLMSCDPWAQEVLRGKGDASGSMPAPRQEAWKPGSELILVQGRVFGEGVQGNDGGLVWVRRFTEREPGGAQWTLPDEPCLLRLSGRAHIDNPLSVGLTGRAVPLRLKFTGRKSGQVVLAELPGARLSAGDGLLLPLAGEFEHWLFLQDYQELHIESAAEAGIIELELSAHRPGGGPGTVGAYDLQAMLRAAPGDRVEAF